MLEESGLTGGGGVDDDAPTPTPSQQCSSWGLSEGCERLGEETVTKVLR
mgnify:FL=1